MTTPVDVKKIAQLARLELSPAEEEKLGAKFQKIMDYMDLLNEVDVSAPGLAKDESQQQLYRPDVAIDSPVHPEDFSPFLENHFFKVPPVIE